MMPIPKVPKHCPRCGKPFQKPTGSRLAPYILMWIVWTAGWLVGMCMGGFVDSIYQVWRYYR